MLTDPFGRKITYLRISITDRCNFRCIYCMPPEGVPLKPHDQILRYEEIVEIVRTAATLGITKIRFTGGEPLVRRDIEYCIEQCNAVAGIEEVCMTTNGSLLTTEKARALKRAGLSRVNISLDTLDPGKFRELTRIGTIEDTLRGINAALETDLTPVKINMIIFADTQQREIEKMREFCSHKNLQLQTISHFSLSSYKQAHRHPADRPLACSFCNRLRLTADGYLKPCLLSDREIKVDMNNIAQSLLDATREKPKSGVSCGSRAMNQIGG
jgi:cyclic pyranopterin phosphate synthase